MLVEPVRNILADPGTLDVCSPEVDALVHASVDRVVDDVR
jgi:hypothetical protein